VKNRVALRPRKSKAFRELRGRLRQIPDDPDTLLDTPKTAGRPPSNFFVNLLALFATSVATIGGIISIPYSKNNNKMGSPPNKAGSVNPSPESLAPPMTSPESLGPPMTEAETDSAIRRMEAILRLPSGPAEVPMTDAEQEQRLNRIKNVTGQP
jgi:hypothetical protein